MSYRNLFRFTPLFAGWVIVGAITGMAGWRVWSDYRHTLKTAESLLSSLARSGAEQLNGLLFSMDVYLHEFDARLMETPKESWPQLTEYLHGRLEVFSTERLAVSTATDQNGIIIFSTRPGLVGVDASQREYFQAAKQDPVEEKMHFTGPVVSTVGKNWLMFASRPRFDSDGNFKGVVTLAVFPEIFEPMTRSIKPDAATGLATFVSGSRKIFSRSPGHQENMGRSLGAGPATIAHFASGKKSTIQHFISARDGVERIAAVHTVTRYGAYMFVAVDRAEVLSPFRFRFTIHATVLFLVNALTLLLAYRLQAREVAILARDAALKTAQVQLSNINENLEFQISERTAALRDRESRMSAIVNTAAEGIITIDERGIIESFNPAAERIFGYDASEMIGRSVNDLMPEPHRSSHDNYVRNYLDTGKSRIIGVGREVEGRRKDGSIFTMQLAVSESVQLGKHTFIGIFHDVTERAKMAARIRASNQLLQDALNSITPGVALFDSNETLVMWNDGYINASSIHRHIIRPGLKYSEIITRLYEHNYFVDADMNWVDSRVRNFRNLEPTEVHARDVDGREHWYLVHHYRIQDGGTFLVRTDLTERIRTERALKQAKAEAEVANKTKSIFLSQMSHELRTPLNAILGFAQLLEYNPKEPLTKSQSESVEAILRGGQLLLNLVNDLLDLAKIESGNLSLTMEIVDPVKVIEECLPLIEGMAEKRNIAVTLNPEFVGCVRADYSRLRQCMLNLLSNAIKYNREGGAVSATVSATSTDGNMIRIAVSDTGPGIPPERKHELFQSFSRLGAETKPIEGNGIGLAVTRELVSLMEGRVGCDSKPGKGSVFWLELPRIETAAVAETPPRATLTAGIEARTTPGAIGKAAESHE